MTTEDGKQINLWIGDLSIQTEDDVAAIMMVNQGASACFLEILHAQLREALNVHRRWVALGVWFRHGGFAETSEKQMLAVQIAALILAEPKTMLPKRAHDILPQLDQPETIVGLRIKPPELHVHPERVSPEDLGDIVAFVTNWNLGVSTHKELGSFVVAPDLRGQGIGTEAVRELLRLNGHTATLATIKTEQARRALQHAGMMMASFVTDIPADVRQATCCCESMGGEACLLADGACRLMILPDHR